MITVTFNKAVIFEDENGNKHLHLELQANMLGMKTIFSNIFAATSNLSPDELLQLPADTDMMLTNTKQD